MSSRITWRPAISIMAQNATNDTFAQYHGTALVIVVAVDQILRFEHRVRQLTGDAALQKARKAFDDEVGDSANNIRDVAMHLDDYAIGIGNRQTGKQGPAVTERYVRNTVYWTDHNENYISLGGHQLSVDRTAMPPWSLRRLSSGSGTATSGERSSAGWQHRTS